jgi:hypothetical protein
MRSCWSCVFKPSTKLPERKMATSNISVLVEFWLHPMRDAMCCKVAGNTLEISRLDLENGNYAPFFDALYEALDGVLDLDDARKLAIETTIEPMIRAASEAPDLILDEEE